MIQMRKKNEPSVNLSLAFTLGLRSLARHRMVALATILGVALGMLVVATILIVDFNTAHSNSDETRLNQELESSPNNVANRQATVALNIEKIIVVKKQDFLKHRRETSGFSNLPGQILEAQIDHISPTRRTGEGDYQTMRLAIRIASLLAFFIGAVIVFYTMQFSVASRSREFCLLRCVGEFRLNIALSLVTEATILGTVGTLLGLFAAFPVARNLLLAGISTTGRLPLMGFEIPYWELGILALTGILIALLGVVAPIVNLYHIQIAQVLQPRFSSDNIDTSNFQTKGFAWILPPLILISYLMIRPFLASWLSVVYLFVFETGFVIVLALATLWWTAPVLRLFMRITESLFNPLLPLETILTGKRMRLMSQKVVFSVTSVILVFSLLTGLHNVIRALKHEINEWANIALVPYEYFRARRGSTPPGVDFFNSLHEAGIYSFRLSAKTVGSLPLRIIRSEDINYYRTAKGLKPLSPGRVILSKTLAARFGVEPGDYLRIDTSNTQHFFEILDVSDEVGFYMEQGQYVDQKSFALFSEANPLFRDNVESTLGQFVMARTADKNHRFLQQDQWELLVSQYFYANSGRSAVYFRVREIDKDFLIFDFVLVMTVLLAVIGIINALFIQVWSRSREFAILTSLGMSRVQIMRLLLVEGLIIGLVGAFLATILGTVLGFISVSFLDHFTLFEYEYVWSAKDTGMIALIAVISCCSAAVYPGLVATRISSAESLHYE